MKNFIIHKNFISIICIFSFMLIALTTPVDAAHFHIYNYNKTIAATCTTAKYTQLKCRCGSTKNVKLSSSLGHNIVIDKAVLPGPYTTGLTDGSHCSRCKAVTKKQNIIPATGNSSWNGKKYSKPVTTEGSYLLITSPEELAWILKNKNTLGKSKLKLKNDIDMNNCTLNSFPDTVKEFNGNNKYIKNLKITGTGLFGNSKGISVSNLKLDNVHVTSSGNAGILVGNLKGNSTFTNCSVINSSAITSNGSAGGFVGYIVRSTKTNRSISLAITLKNCSVEKTVISASKAEGKFVGILSGYDNNEKLTFTNCSSNIKVKDYSTYYTSHNQSMFLNSIDSKYNGFLGREIYCRGIITFDGNRFIPKWDGKTVITPLLADPKYDGNNVIKGDNRFVVYSPFDLAGIRAKTDAPSAIYLKEHIDMNGQGKDGKYNVPSNFEKSKFSSTDDKNFEPFKSITTLDGNNKTIYNLAISRQSTEAGAFILSASGTTVHKNINFNNCQTISTHKQVKSDAKAYGAILIANATGSSYTMENITATNCKVFALQKVGTLAGNLGATNSYVNNCKVENCYIENYICKIPETFSSGEKSISVKGWTGKITVSANFYPHGEVGGMFGFVQNNSKISNCHVKGTTIFAYGQKDKQASLSGSRLITTSVRGLGYYLVPGRHVGTFIGDIRATGNIKISNCSVDSASRTSNTSDKHNNTYSYIGQAYFVKYLDPEGKTVSVDGKNLILANCNVNTKR